MRHKSLWTLVVGVATGDITTTIYGIQNGAHEANPLLANIMSEIGVIHAMVLGKVVAIGLGLIMQRYMDSKTYLIPLAMLLVWAPVVLANLYVISKL